VVSVTLVAGLPAYTEPPEAKKSVNGVTVEKMGTSQVS
jgi:hypothetical protein